MSDFSKYRLSVAALVAANAVPLVGVLFFDWSVFGILSVYWAENVVIGALNVLKMILCSPDPEQMQIVTSGRVSPARVFEQVMAKRIHHDPNSVMMHHGAKLFFIPFFVLHFGIFCLVHGVFIFALFGNEGAFAPPVAFHHRGVLGSLGSGFFGVGLAMAILSFAISHFYSFWKNYLRAGEYRRTTVLGLMFLPYGRIVVMHLTLLAGGFAVMLLHSAVLALVILVIGKTVMDVRSHLREHQHLESTEI